MLRNPSPPAPATAGSRVCSSADNPLNPPPASVARSTGSPAWPRSASTHSWITLMRIKSLEFKAQPILLDRVAQLGFQAEAIVGQPCGFGFVNFDPVGALRALPARSARGGSGPRSRYRVRAGSRNQAHDRRLLSDRQYGTGGRNSRGCAAPFRGRRLCRRPERATRWRIRRHRYAPICRRCAGSISVVAPR